MEHVNAPKEKGASSWPARGYLIPPAESQSVPHRLSQDRKYSARIKRRQKKRSRRLPTGQRFANGGSRGCSAHKQSMRWRACARPLVKRAKRKKLPKGVGCGPTVPLTTTCTTFPTRASRKSSGGVVVHSFTPTMFSGTCRSNGSDLRHVRSIPNSCRQALPNGLNLCVAYRALTKIVALHRHLTQRCRMFRNDCHESNAEEHPECWLTARRRNSIYQVVGTARHDAPHRTSEISRARQTCLPRPVGRGLQTKRP